MNQIMNDYFEQSLIGTSIRQFESTGQIPAAFFAALSEAIGFDMELLATFSKYRNRPFVIGLLAQLCDRRRVDPGAVDADEIMAICYLLGLHGHVEDSLLIWRAKYTDFDTYSLVDIQLVTFAGVDPTLEYLAELDTEEAAKAINYIRDCDAAGDFDDMADRYLPVPWFFGLTQIAKP
jgi:hypothetical protein